MPDYKTKTQLEQASVEEATAFAGRLFLSTAGFVFLLLLVRDQTKDYTLAFLVATLLAAVIFACSGRRSLK